MGWIEGLIGGFTERRGEYERQQREEAAHRAQQESRVYDALLKAEDPDVRAMALTSLIDLAQGPKKKKGLRGFLGEMEQSENLPRIRQLMQSPVATQETTPGITSRGFGVIQPAGRAPSLTPAAPAPGSAAMAGEAMTDGGGAPPPIPWQRATGPSTTRTVMKPRTIFPSHEQLMEREIATTRGKRQAETEAELAGQYRGLTSSGVPEMEAREAITQRVGGSRAASSFQAGPMFEITGADGTKQRIQSVRDARTGKLLNGLTGEPIPATAQPILGTGTGRVGATPMRTFQAIERDTGQYGDKSPTGYWKIVYDAISNEALSIVPHEYTPPPMYAQAPPTPTGERTRFNSRTGRWEADPNAPPANIDNPEVVGDEKALKAIDAAIKAQFGDPSDLINRYDSRMQAAVKAKRDELARAAGYESYSELQSRSLQPRRAPARTPVADPGIIGQGVQRDHDFAAILKAKMERGDPPSPYERDFVQKYQQKYHAGAPPLPPAGVGAR